MNTTKLTSDQFEKLREFTAPEYPSEFKIHLIEQGLFINVLKADPDVQVRLSALLASPDSVDDFVSDASSNIREYVARMTKSEQILEILSDDPTSKVRTAVARRKFDKKFLDDEFGCVRSAAIKSGISFIDKIIADADPNSQWL